MPELEGRLVATKQQFKSGDDKTLDFELTNRGDEDVHVLTWYTPLEGLWSDCLEVTRDGERVPYDGPLAKRGQPTENDYVLIPAGQTVSRSFALHRAYNVSPPGQYDVALDTEVQDYVTAEGDDTLNTKLGASERVTAKQTLRGGATQFVVEPDGGHLPTEGEEVRKSEKSNKKGDAGAAAEAEKKAGPKDPEFNGGDAAQQAATRQAHADGYALAVAAVAALSDNAQYKEWFGAHTAQRLQLVKEHYTKVRDTMQTTTFKYDLTSTGCGGSVYAYTYKGTTTVWMCDLFWSAPATGTDSKAGTVLHELTHAIAFTDDITYGQAKCRQLAIDNPDKAVRNADTHEYYAGG
ncbi:MAG TPA: M35 family metallopeptidase [Pyrinomonadaceae bacterium]|jgi:hypothetical protein